MRLLLFCDSFDSTMNTKYPIGFLTAIVALLSLAGISVKPALSNMKASKNGISQKPVETKPLGMVRFTAESSNPYFIIQPKIGEAYLYVEATSSKYQAAGQERTPLNLSLVIDRSGSMSGDKIIYCKKAAKFVVDQLSPEDYLSIVIYDNEISVLQSSAKVKDKQLFKNKIDEIFDRGGTNLCGGMIKGFEQVADNYKSGFVNRVLLMSDGLANEGITSTEQIQQTAATWQKDKGITISTFGVGTDYNEDLMQGIAESGMGNYYFINDPEKIPSIFSKELNGLLNLVAKNMTLTIELPKEIQLSQVFGYKYDQVGNKVTVNFRDVFSEETKGVMLKLTVPANTMQALNYSCHLQFEDMVNKSGIQQSTISGVINPIYDTILFNASMSKYVMEKASIFEANYNVEHAQRLFDQGKYDEARTYMWKNNMELKEKINKYEFNSEEARQMDSLGVSYEKLLENAESMNEQDKKYLQKESKSLNYNIKTQKQK